MGSEIQSVLNCTRQVTCLIRFVTIEECIPAEHFTHRSPPQYYGKHSLGETIAIGTSLLISLNRLNSSLNNTNNRYTLDNRVGRLVWICDSVRRIHCGVANEVAHARIPKALWKDLKAQGLMHADAPGSK